MWSLLLAGCSSEDLDPGDPPDGGSPGAPGWHPGAPLPVAQQECGVVALDGQIVVIGGYDAAGAMVATVRAYDPVADAWSDLPDLPGALHHPNVAVLDGQIHVAGALAQGFFEVPVHLVLDGLDDEGWTALDPVPAARAVGAAGVAVLDGRLHLVGGLQLTRSVALHSAWDPETGWEALPDAPSARDHLALGAIDGELVATAGRADGIRGFVAATERWDPETGWSAGAPIPTPRGGVAAAVGPDGELHVVGGEGNEAEPTGVFATHERYDPASDTWTAEGPMASPRHGTGGAWVDGVLWVPGGAATQGFGAVTTTEGFRPEP